jgi:hypothetical protein
MNTPHVTEGRTLPKILALLGGALCALCCALPIAGMMLGIGALGALAAYLEHAALALLVLAAGSFALWRIRRQRTTPAASCGDACSVGCACNSAYAPTSE